MAKKYDPLKSNMSSYFKKPKKTWSDRRSGDAVGRGPGKKGSYKAYASYHSLPKMKAARRSSSAKSVRRGSSAKPRTASPLRGFFSLFAPNEPTTEVTVHEYTTAEVEIAPEVVEITPLPEVDDEKGPVFDRDKPTNTDHCPYCGLVFTKIPKRGRVCEQCGQKFVVRSRHILYNSDFLTLEESAANDCFFCTGTLTDTPIKQAKAILAKQPELTFTELFMEMIAAFEARHSKEPGEVANVVAEAYQNLARYEEACGRSTVVLKQLIATKNREHDEYWKQVEKIARGGDL